ncbi:MAG: exo-alpha-sialidase [Phycisphaerae bacterium]|nr:exo-alpha-sialidase [Phycisphaerae bacterium]
MLALRNGLSIVVFLASLTTRSSRAIPATESTTNRGVEALSFRYADGQPCEITMGRYVGGPPGKRVSKSTPIVCRAHRHEREIPSIEKMVYVCASFPMGDANPAPYLDNQPAACQTVTAGHLVDGRFTPAVRFGMVDDDRASPKKMANYTPGLFDGQIEYFGMFARPRTTYDFRVRLDLDQKRVSAWAYGQGDDEWFPLATDAPLMNPVPAINAVRVEQLPWAGGVERLMIQDRPWPEGERVRPHPKAKKDRLVRPGKGFKLQSMRSLWRQADRHVTVARTPNAPNGWWLGFPDVVQTGPTSLVCVHNDGAGHGGGGRVWVRHSADLGKTWAKPVVVHPGGVNCPRIQKLRDDSLLVLADIREGGKYPVVFYGSTDGGHTWSHLGKLDPVPAGGHDCCVPSHVTEMADGAWLVHGTYTPGKAWKVTQGETLEFYRSADRGKTWTFYSDLKPPPPLSVCESSIVPLPDGRWWLIARESGGFIPGVKAFSKDEGKTWSSPEELPFFIQGRTAAGLLEDGRVMVTFRACTGPAALWAWTGTPDEPPCPVIRGVHFNDRSSVGLKDGSLHIDNDGLCGEFTKYVLRVPDGPEGRIEVTADVKVVSNNGRAATLVVPFAGKLRLFPDRVQMAHDPSLQAKIAPNGFHEIRVVAEAGKMTLSIDGRQVLATDKTEKQVCPLAWSPLKMSPYLPSFGNEEAEDNQAGFDWVPQSERETADADERLTKTPQVILPKHVTPAATGYSVWRSVVIRYEHPKTGTRSIAWQADKDGFPDQYQQDRILEVGATVSGCDQGYSGWCKLTDGRIFIVNYTDDTARWNRDASFPPLGVSWIRGTYVLPADLPQNPVRPK